MSQLNFYQIFPKQKMPIAADTQSYNLPKRAKSFCYPFKQAANTGVYAFPPIDFSIFQSEDYLDISVPTSAGQPLIKRLPKRVGAANFIALGEINSTLSKQCLQQYRQRIKAMQDLNIPAFIDIDSFGFYEVMLNILVEEDPFGFYLQIWLGGVVTLSSPNKQSVNSNSEVLIKHPTNIAHDCGFMCLDAVIDTAKWQGWLAVVIKPQVKNEWVHFNQQTPICQIIALNQANTSLSSETFDNIPDKYFVAPLQWHLFDTDYGVKLGKYQRLMPPLR